MLLLVSCIEPEPFFPPKADQSLAERGKMGYLYAWFEDLLKRINLLHPATHLYLDGTKMASL